MKVPEPRRLSNGDWYIYLRLNGKGIPVQDSNKAACKAKAASIKARYKAGELDIKPPTEKDTTPTLGAVLDAYIAKYEPVLSPATVRGYGIIRRNRFKDEMEEPVDAIDFQKMVNHELKAASPKTVKNAWGLIGSALKDSGRAVPSVRCAPVPVKEIPFLQPEEIKPFLEAAKGDGAELYILLMLHSLRISEARAVMANKTVDLSSGKIHVKGAIVPDKTNTYIAKETNKNQTSTRSINIMIPRFRVLWEAYVKGDYVPTVDHPTVILRHTNRICQEAGVTVVGNHGLRHSFASLAYDLGWSERMIMDVGGWSNTATAHKIYIRVAQSRKLQSQDSMALFYENANQNAN